MTDAADLDGILESEREGYLAYRAKAAGTNVSEQTLLATDYLNHFNEIIMLLEIVPDMPDCLADAQAWQPKSYQDHFRDSSVHDKDLAIAAYDHVPSKYRKPFEETIQAMERLVFSGIERLSSAVGENADPDVLRLIATTTSRNLQRLMDHASAIIHGSDRALPQEEIDALIDG